MRGNNSFYFTVPAKYWQLSCDTDAFFPPPWHHRGVSEGTQAPLHPLRRRVQFVQFLTIVWMALEAGASLLAAWLARSPALLAFGGDSLIELLSASVVLWRFSTPAVVEHAEKRAAQIAGVLLLLLAAYVAVISALTLLGQHEPKPSLPGICILIAAGVVMPLLAREKRRLSAATGSAALRADAAESSVCGYLALIALTGLLVNYLWNVGRADPIAAFALVPFILYEAREAFRGKACTCAA